MANYGRNVPRPDFPRNARNACTIAAENCRVIVFSHRPALVGEPETDKIGVPIRLENQASETVLQGAELLCQYGRK